MFDITNLRKSDEAHVQEIIYRVVDDNTWGWR
jgi:hypothetical protein